MHEIELKLGIPPAAKAAVKEAVAGGPTSGRIHLVAIYYDTPDRRLAAAGMALRVRKEGRQWVQTLKAGGPHAMQRLEHNVPLRGATAASVTADPSRHTGTPAGDLLAAALARRPDDSDAPELIETFRTDIRRLTRSLRTAQGTVELAYDAGWITAGERKQAVSELEIELLRGQPLAVITQARRWVQQHGLWLDTQTKAHRGDLLARRAQAQPVKAAQPQWPANTTAAQAWQRLHAWLFDVLLANASILAQTPQVQQAGAPDLATPPTDRAETLRLLRVALRRLRAGWRLAKADGLVPEPAALDGVRSLFAELGRMRDRDVLTDLLPALQAAGAPALPQIADPHPHDSGEVAALMQARATNLLWLDLLQAAILPAPEAALPAETRKAAAPWARQTVKTLRSWQTRALRGVKRIATLDDEALHDLRKQLKRLRYGVEMMQALLPQRESRRWLKMLAEGQDALGAYNDLVMAHAAVQEPAQAGDAGAAFALGWIKAQLPHARARACKAAGKLAEGPKWWPSDKLRSGKLRSSRAGTAKGS